MGPGVRSRTPRFGAGTRRSLVVAGVLASVVLVASAVVFAVSSGTRSITMHAQALHLSDEALRVASTARAQVGLAAHFAAVEREFGTDTSEVMGVSLREGQQALDVLGIGIAELAASSGVEAQELTNQFNEFSGVGAELNSLLSSGDSLAAEERLAAFDAGFKRVADLLIAERDHRLRQVQSSDALMARLGDVGRFLVALLIPLVVIGAYREMTRRQQRRAELEVRLDAEREVGKARDDFVANASHEFRTPLTSIYGLSQLLEEDVSLPEAARDMAGMIASEAADLSRMVEDLLTTARLEAGALTFQAEQVMTHEEVTDVVRPFNRGGRSVETAVKPAVVRVDRMRQRQALRNLLSNAQKYGGENIRVTGRRDGDWFEWVVADDGDGVPEELRARLFERFIHQGSSVVVPGGVGLGLSIVKALAEGMGGSVAYLRTDDGWTEFVFRVPLAAPSRTVTHLTVDATGQAGAGFQIAASNPFASDGQRDD